MLSNIAVAAFLLVCLGSFVSVNLHNILVVRRSTGSVEAREEVDRPSELAVDAAAAGTIAYFLLASAYPFLVFTGQETMPPTLSLQLQPSAMIDMQIVGLALTGAGYSLFVWSAIARARYAVSWAMTENHRLVTWGPYRYVRHPSYLGYFLMFLGLFFVWPHLLTLFPLIAIPGYVRVTGEEEKLLLSRFGEQFLEYQRRTGRFIPKLG